MASTVSSAQAEWSGDLASGGGTVAPGSGAFPALPVSWARRTQRETGFTSPEELLASAHSACYCMALSNELAKAGTPAEKLTAAASVTFETGQPGGAAITLIRIEVLGRVPGSDAGAFAEAAGRAAKGCPVSKALAAVPIEVSATLG